MSFLNSFLFGCAGYGLCRGICDMLRLLTLEFQSYNSNNRYISIPEHSIQDLTTLISSNYGSGLIQLVDQEPSTDPVKLLMLSKNKHIFKSDYITNRHKRNIKISMKKLY
jgi:hypothetical protein